mmetsp:Transcript_12716/g.28097  ORF Transcript_12716/g.28097 Transcript_12716/m.28097 type:complete len:410 (-) Transcript_12716:1446-2675(-)
MAQHVLDFVNPMVEVDCETGSECRTKHCGLGHPGAQHLAAEQVGLKLHQEVVGGHSSINMHSTEVLAEVFLHGLHDVHGAEGDSLEGSTAEVFPIRVESHANSDCPRVLAPVGGEEPAEGRHERHAAGVLHRLRQGFDLASILDEPHVVAKPLHCAAGASHRAFQGVVGLGLGTKLETDSGQQAALRRDGLEASVEKHEASSAIGVLGGTHFNAALTKQGSVLVTQGPSDGDAVQTAEARHEAVDLGVGLDGGQAGLIDAQLAADGRVPGAGFEVHEHVTGGVGDVGDVKAAVVATSQVVDQPGLDGSEHASLVIDCLLDLRNIVDQPLHLDCREVGRDWKACFGSEAILATLALAELADCFAGTCVEPHNRLVVGLASHTVPGHSGLTLVCDTNSSNLPRLGTGLLQH